MRKLAFLLVAFALVAVSFYGCDKQPNPLALEAADDAAVASRTTTAPAAEYYAVILDALADFDRTTLESINNDGTIVGWGFLEERVVPVVWEDGVPRELPLHVSGSESHAFDINNGGDIVGWHSDLGGVLWRNDVPTDLGVGASPYPAHDVWANAINESGQVVGEVYREEVPWVAAFLWTRGEWSELPMLDGLSECIATDINESGYVVGNCWPRAVMWYKDGVVALDVGGTYSYAIAINSSGQVVGNSSDGAFLWEKGETQPLPTLGGRSGASDINDAGQIVGSSWTSTDEPHAVLWDRDRMLDLGPGWASAINNQGWIIGRATRPNGDNELVLWKPLNQ